MTQEDNTTERPQFAPPPPIHLILVTQQLGLTPEEAQEANDKCVCAQKEIQREFEEEDWVRHNRIAKADTHLDETRQVHTHPTAHSQPAPHMYKMLYEPPQATTLLDSGSIDHRDPPDHTRRYQLPTPTAHPELEQVTSYDVFIMSDSGDTPPVLLPGTHLSPLHRTTYPLRLTMYPPTSGTTPQIPNIDPDVPHTTPAPALHQDNTLVSKRDHIM